MTKTQEIPDEIMREAERCMRETNTVHHIALALLARDTAARKECADIAREIGRDLLGVGKAACNDIATAIEATITGGVE